MNFRFIFCPITTVGSKLKKFKPCVISKCMGTLWCSKKFQVEVKKIETEGEDIEIKRRVFEKFVLYSNNRAWMTSMIFSLEMKRLSEFLKPHFPGEKFCLLVDNCPSNKREELDNLEIIFFPKNTTGYLQPLDLLIFSVLKYYSYFKFYSTFFKLFIFK